MIRIGLTAGIAIALAGCGHGAASPSSSPPPASVTTSAGTHGLTIGSYCWTRRTATGDAIICADSAGPAAIPGLTTVPAAVGETIVVRLRFTPTHPVQATIGPVRYRLPAAATLRLRVRRPGLLIVDPRRGSDDVQYMARIVRVAS